MEEVTISKETITPKSSEQAKKPSEVKETPTKEQLEGRNLSKKIRQKTQYENGRLVFELAAGIKSSGNKTKLENDDNLVQSETKDAPKNPKSSALEEEIDSIHKKIEPNLARSGIREFSKSGDPKSLAPEVLELSQKHRNMLDRFDKFITSPQVQSILEERHEKYKIADQLTQGKTNKERIEERMAQCGDEIELVFDLDNTITDHSKQKKQGMVDPNLLGSAVLDPYIGTNREYFPEAYSAGWQELVDKYPEVFTEGGMMTKFRDGMPELLEALAKDPKIHVTILSTSFEPFVKEVLNKIPNSEKFSIISITKRNLLSSGKGDWLKSIAYKNPQRSVFYIGDGKSDIPTLEAQDAVTGYFALEGSTFEEALKNNNVLYLPYKSGDDLKPILFPEAQKGSSTT